MARRLRQRWIAFDLGGVLFDIDVDRYFDGAARDFSVAREAVARATFDAGCWPLAERGYLDGPSFLGAVLVRLGQPAGAAEVDRLRRCWNAILTLRPGVPMLLARLARPAVAWSNTDPEHAATIAALLAPPCDWSRSTLSCAIRVEKPNPDFYQQALARLAATPAQVCYVDDRSDNVAAAVALGIDGFVASSLGGVHSGLAARGLLLH